MRCLRLLFLVLALLPTGLLSAGEVELVVDKGDRVRCVIISEDDTKIMVRRPVIMRGKRSLMEVTYLKERIISRSEVRPVLEEYAERVKETGDEMEAQTMLARWCVERCLVDQALVHAKRAIALDLSASWPRKVMSDLGYLEVKGVWVVEEDYLAKNNLARWGEKIIPRAEYDQRVSLRAAISERDEAEKVVNAFTEALELAKPDKMAEMSRKVSDLQREAATAKKQQENLTNQLKQVKERLDRLKKGAPSGSGNAKDNHQRQLDREQEQYTDIQKKLAELTATAAKSERDANNARQRLESLKKLAATAKTDLPDAQARLAKAQAEVDRLCVGLSDLPPGARPSPPKVDPPPASGKDGKPAKSGSAGADPAGGSPRL